MGMLKFEFVQPGEFVDPYYKIIDTKEAGVIYYNDKWELDYISTGMSSNQLDQISAKLKQLNKDLK